MFTLSAEVKEVGYKYGQAHRVVPEMIPELIVPDLTNCKVSVPYELIPEHSAHEIILLRS